LAGSLKRELNARYGIHPKMRHAYHQLDVLVDGRRVFSYHSAPGIPTVESILAAIEASQKPDGIGVGLAGQL
jgi:hypothetical protein